MTLAITADGTTFASDGAVTLAVTGATGGLPIGSPVYTANFAAGYDGWAGGTDSAPAAPTCSVYSAGVIDPGRNVSLWSGSDWSDAAQYLGRTITGLTIGHTYTVTVETEIALGPSSVLAYVGVVGITNADPVALVKTAYTALAYTFTATATSHVVQVRRTTGTAASLGIRSIVVQRVSTVVTSTLSITRTDSNGERFVRLQDGAAPDATGAMTAVDYEAPFSGGTYRVIDAAGNVATVVWAGLSDPSVDQVHIVAVGTYRVLTLPRVDGLDQGYEFRDSGNSLAILGRTGPIITTRSDNQWTKRKGTITYHAADENDVHNIVEYVYKASRVVFLRTSEPVGDLYHVASSIRVKATVLGVSGWAYDVEVEYQEINWPEGFLAGATWTYADVLAGYLAYFDLPIAFATYAALATG